MKYEQEQKIKDFIGESVRFDEYGSGYLWGKQEGEVYHTYYNIAKTRLKEYELLY